MALLHQQAVRGLSSAVERRGGAVLRSLDGRSGRSVLPRAARIVSADGLDAASAPLSLWPKIRRASRVRSPGAVDFLGATAAVTARGRSSRLSVDDDDDDEDEDGSDGDDSALTAVLRDATATASTSSSSGRAPPRRSAPSAAAAAAAAAPAQHAQSNGVPLAAAPLNADHAAAAAPEHLSPAPPTASGQAPTLHPKARAGKAPPGKPQPAAAAKPPKQAHPLPEGLTAERDRDIYEEMRSCEDWRDVLDIVADEAALLSVRTAVQALTRLNMLTRSAGRHEMLQLPAFRALTARLISQVPLMNNVQLSNSLFAFAQMHVPVPPEALKAYYNQCNDRASDFYPRDISTLFAAMAALRCSPPVSLMDIMGYRAKAFLSAGQFEARGIPTLLHASVQLGYRNPLLAAEAAAQLLLGPANINRMEPQGVSNTVWALARMESYNPQAVAAALAAFASQPLSYKPQECANLLWALTAFRHHPEGTFVDFARCLLAQLPQLRAADLATALYALAFFNVAPGPRVLRSLCGRAQQLLEAGEVSCVELCNMYWGLGVLGEVELPLFGALEAAIAAEFERGPEQQGEELLRMSFQAFLASRLSGTERPHAFSPPVLDAMKRCWVDTVSGRAAAHGALTRVSYILRELSVKHDVSRPTRDGLALIDLALKAGPERYIALQFLNPADQCVNTKQLLGQLQLERKVIEKNGWEVKYMRIGDMSRLDPDVQFDFVSELLRSMGLSVKRAAAGEGGDSKGGEGKVLGEGKGKGGGGKGGGGKGGGRNSKSSLF